MCFFFRAAYSLQIPLRTHIAKSNRARLINNTATEWGGALARVAPTTANKAAETDPPTVVSVEIGTSLGAAHPAFYQA